MNKTNTRLVRIDMLREGGRFEIPSLSETMKNMKLISVSDCSSLIEGQKRDSLSDPWKPFRFHVSNSVLVTPISEFTTMKETIMNNNTTTNENMTNSDVSQEKKSRGRPKKHRVEFYKLNGTAIDFTIKTLAQENNIETYQAQTLVKEALESGKIQNVGELKNSRGKPQKVYRLV